MGSCASIYKGSNPNSAIKHGLHFGSKTDKLVIPESPIKDNKHVYVDLPVKTFDAYNYGSKDESFFDSRPWLESDCEDDFFSVKGEFTPSCGSTPVHHSFSASGTPARNQISPSIPEPSPKGQKKRLSELFRESRGEDMYQYVEDLSVPDSKNNAEGTVESKSTLRELLPQSPQGTPYISGPNSVCGSERTPNGNPLFEREKSENSTQCCLPSLISCRSFRERKKMSPAVAINGKA